LRERVARSDAPGEGVTLRDDADVIRPDDVGVVHAGPSNRSTNTGITRRQRRARVPAASRSRSSLLQSPDYSAGYRAFRLAARSSSQPSENANPITRATEIGIQANAKI